MKKKLATSGTKEGLKGLIAKFYYSTPDKIELREDGTVFKGKALSTTWSKEKGRYVFWI